MKWARANPCGRRSVLRERARDEISFAVRAWAYVRGGLAVQDPLMAVTLK